MWSTARSFLGPSLTSFLFNFSSSYLRGTGTGQGQGRQKHLLPALTQKLCKQGKHLKLLCHLRPQLSRKATGTAVRWLGGPRRGAEGPLSLAVRCLQWRSGPSAPPFVILSRAKSSGLWGPGQAAAIFPEGFGSIWVKP